MSSFYPAFRAMPTHLVDESGDISKTLCGVAIVECEWRTDWDTVADDKIVDRIGCECRKCQNIAASRIAAAPKLAGEEP